MRRSRLFLFSIFTILTICVGCGGGNRGVLTPLTEAGGEQNLQFGSLITRIAGTAQPPVSSGGSGTVVTGLAGATVNSLVMHQTGVVLDQTKIVFQNNRDGNYDIYIMNADGTGQTRLTTSSLPDSQPSFSPDGTKVAFVTGGEIYVMNSDGTGQSRVTNGASVTESPSWSPNGRKLAFQSTKDGDYEIYTINMDGSGLTQLTFNTTADGGASWSSNDKIAFHRFNTRYDIYVMNSDGSNVIQLTNTTNDNETVPAWSPDGTKLAFEADRDGNTEIYVMNSDGTGQIRLTDNSAFDSMPTWSPDGRKLAFMSNRDGKKEIYMMNANGSSQTRLTTSVGDSAWPNWSPALTKRITLIGTDGKFGTASAGFLFGQNGDAVTSVVAFDTPLFTRANTRVTVQTGNSPGNSNYVFTVTASDKLTQLAYVNNVIGTPITVLGSGGVAMDASGAVVSFNASTGKVSSVLPYTASRSEGAPVVSMDNGARVLRGKFLGVWDATGKNIAPSGATVVHLDTRTGAVITIK